MAEKKQTENVNQLAAALINVQGQLSALTPNHTAHTGTYGYSYADLAAVWDLVRPLLAKEQIAVVQMPEDASDGNSIRLTTTLLHASGERMSSTLSMPYAQNTPQSVGSALTYARRYALCAMLGVTTTGEDDDAKTAETDRRPAAAARQDGDVAVTKVETKPTSTGGTRYLVYFSDGERFSTFDDALGNLAQECAETGEAVEYATEQKGKWINLVHLSRSTPELVPAGDVEPPPLTEDDIPF